MRACGDCSTPGRNSVLATPRPATPNLNAVERGPRPYAASAVIGHPSSQRPVDFGAWCGTLTDSADAAPEPAIPLELHHDHAGPERPLDARRCRHADGQPAAALLATGRDRDRACRGARAESAAPRREPDPVPVRAG